VAIVNALQLEAARRHASPFPLLYDAHAKFKVAGPIYCCIIAYLLLIHYFTPWPWPWPLTLNICSVSSVTWWNSVPNVNTIQ